MCLKFAETLSPEMTWRERLVAVIQFINMLRHAGPSTPTRPVGAKVSAPYQTVTATAPVPEFSAGEIETVTGKE